MFTSALYLLLALSSFESAPARQPPPTSEPQTYVEEFEVTADAPCFIVMTDDGVTEVCQ